MENTESTQVPKFKCICPKHGEIRQDYVFRTHMPEFGYDHMAYCLVCAVEYLSMISQEIKFEIVEEETKQ